MFLQSGGFSAGGQQALGKVWLPQPLVVLPPRKRLGNTWSGDPHSRPRDAHLDDGERSPYLRKQVGVVSASPRSEGCARLADALTPRDFQLNAAIERTVRGIGCAQLHRLGYIY